MDEDHESVSLSIKLKRDIVEKIDEYIDMLGKKNDLPYISRSNAIASLIAMALKQKRETR